MAEEVQVLGLLYALGRPDEALGSWHQPGPALAITSIWGVRQQKDHLCVFPVIVTSKLFFFKNEARQYFKMFYLVERQSERQETVFSADVSRLSWTRIRATASKSAASIQALEKTPSAASQTISGKPNRKQRWHSILGTVIYDAGMPGWLNQLFIQSLQVEFSLVLGLIQKILNLLQHIQLLETLTFPFSIPKVVFI